MSIPEEGKTTSEGVNVKTSFQSCFYVRDTICNCECDFLRCCGTCFTDMVTGDRNCIPFWNVLRTIFEDISDQTHGRFWRENVSTASCILFQNIILNCTHQFSGRYTLFFSYCDIHCQQNRRWSVDCHGCGYFAKVDAVEQDFHIFQGVNRNTYFTNFAFSYNIIRVITDLCRQVECTGKTSCTGLD